MTTQEERLTTLEQEQAKYSEAISDLNHHVTILTGIMSRQEWDIREMKSSLRAIDGRLNSVDGRLNSVDGRLNALEGNLNSVDSRLGSLEQSVNNRFGEQGKKLDQILLILNTLTSK
ncbi:MAG: hypothetical protein ABI406_05910 [Ktedonobacteraceae bacterium]